MPLKDIALTFVPQLGVRGAAYLIRHFGSAEAVYAASVDETCHAIEGKFLFYSIDYFSILSRIADEDVVFHRRVIRMIQHSKIAIKWK
mgnify:CR=1 FL=1